MRERSIQSSKVENTNESELGHARASFLGGVAGRSRVAKKIGSPVCFV